MLRIADPEEVGMPAERIRHVLDLAKGWVEQGVTPALVVLAARHGKIVLHDAFGKLTPEPSAPPVEPDTIFPIASISKTFTATLAMILVEDGLLGLNRPVQEYVPEFVGDRKDQVMVHQLLTHTSGLTEGDIEAHLKRKGVAGFYSIPEGRYPQRAEWLYGGLDAPLTRQPGTAMAYTSFGIEILGEIVQRVSGESLEAFARRRLFDPLGMTSTWFVVPESVDHRIVRRPADNRFAILDGEWLRRTPMASAGAFSTAPDLATFGQMILEGGSQGGVRILSPASVAEMTRNQIPGIGASYMGEVFAEASWGFCWNVEGGKKYLRRPSLLSDRAVSHGGRGTYILVDPTYDLVGVYCSVSLAEYLSMTEKWDVDLFVNAVIAAIEG